MELRGPKVVEEENLIRGSLLALGGGEDVRVGGGELEERESGGEVLLGGGSIEDAIWCVCVYIKWRVSQIGWGETQKYYNNNNI